MNPAQARRREEEPPARGRVAAGYVRPVGVDLRQFDLSTRQALLDAAVARFARDGYRGTSVAEIARDARLSGTAPTGRCAGSTTKRS